MTIDYRNTSAADDFRDPDGPEVIDLDEWEFDWDDDGPDDDPDRLGTIWGRYGGTNSTDRAERIAAAHKLVQGFVDTFATGDKPYEVSFSDGGYAIAPPAGTNFDARKVMISHQPLFDPTLTPEEANIVLTAMACHESSHVRYGLTTARAAQREFREFRYNQTALNLSNILDDHRIERRFTADYPGYEHVFAPATKYVAEATVGAGGKLDPSSIDGVRLAAAAIRYDEYTAWTPETEAERIWWRAWAERWSATDRGTDHVRGIREGLAHIAATPPPPQRTPTDAGNDTGSGGASGDNAGNDTEANDGTSQSGNAAAEAAPVASPTGFGSGEFGDAIIAAARGNGSDNLAGPSYDANAIVAESRLLEQIDTGEYGQIFRVPPKHARHPVVPDRAATAAIRAAFSRSRTGHYGIERNFRSGRLDNRSLMRVAFPNDDRLFARRTAVSEGRYKVWLMVDSSGSMAGHPARDAASVAAALAAATRLMPNIDLEVWAWGDPGSAGPARLLAAFRATRIYRDGAPIGDLGMLPNMAAGGTPDDVVLRWAAKAIRAETPPGTHPVIIMASDGNGTLIGEPPGYIAELAKANDVQIISVALGAAIAEKTQAWMYGRGKYVTWRGSMAATAKPLGELIARIAAGKA